jgi:membrane protease YdiL (CAAX protease family)
MSTTQINSQLFPATNPSAFAVWARKHPLIAYFSLAFAGTWLLDLPMVLGKDGLGLFSYSVPMAIYIILFLLSSFSGPTLAAFVVTNAIEGREGMRKLFRRYGQWRAKARWYFLVIFGFPIIYIAASIALQGVPVEALRANWMTFFSTYLPALLIFPAFITWSEEPGWRGFALTRLQENYHPLVASLIVGFMHGFWHLPVFLLVFGPPALGPFDLTKFVTNILAIMVLTVIWSWVFNKANRSILFAVLLHASLNASQAWMHNLIPNYPDDAGKVALGFYVFAAIALVIFTKGRLGYKSDSLVE